MFFNFHGTLEDLILFGRYNIILIYSFKFHNTCFLSLGQKCSNLFLKKKKKVQILNFIFDQKRLLIQLTKIHNEDLYLDVLNNVIIPK